jgi:general secretion pathway protein E
MSGLSSLASSRPIAPRSSSIVHAAPTHRELTKPLSKLIPKQGAMEFSQVFKDLVSHGVSDVHMIRSGQDGTFTVEARVDGKKQLVHSYKGTEAQTIVTKIKTGAKLTTGTMIIPEDGSYPLTIDGYPYLARAVALPSFDGGERIVFRLPQVGPLRTIDELGFTATNLDRTKELLDIPGGMTLVAGPTAEGKSTTSLSMLTYLQALSDDGVVITLEDPVERVMPGMTQMEVKDVDGARFEDMMKFLVRADANILFIAEIRDRGTATAAVELAKAGRRVIATIHAKDNVGALLRLVGLADDEPLSVLDSVNGVVSQRLVPRLVHGTDRFSGRHPIHEVTTNTDVLTDALISNTSRSAVRAAGEASSTTFKDNVRELVTNGITTYAEARKTVLNV